MALVQRMCHHRKRVAALVCWVYRTGLWDGRAAEVVRGRWRKRPCGARDLRLANW